MVEENETERRSGSSPHGGFASAGTPGTAGPSESARAERLAAADSLTAIEKVDTRDLNDRGRLAEEARAQVEKQAADLRAVNVPIETEPPAAYRP